MALNTVTLRWDVTDLTQAGIAATLSITPTAQLSDTADHELISGLTSRQVSFTGSGQLAGIVANDNSALLPANSGYLISVTSATGHIIVPQFQTQILFSNGATQWLDALAIVPSVATSYQYLPLPTGTASAGRVPVATGSGEASAWGDASGLGLVNAVTQYGADPAGAADSTTAIQNALNAAAAGQVVSLPPGTYKLSSPLTVPSLVTLSGAASISVTENVQDGAGQAGTVLKPTAAFSGGEVLYLTDNAGARAIGGSVRNLTIDGSSYTATALDGIRGHGPVIQVMIWNVAIENMSGWGINTLIDSGATGNQYPYWWDVDKVIVNECAAGGCSLTNMTDATWRDVYVLFCGKGGTPGPGWAVTNCDNTHFTDCRAEWCGTSGLHVTGAWTTGTGAGGCLFTGFSTDRNEQNGVLIDATGNSPVVFIGTMLRRDGRNAKTGGGSYAGLALASTTLPVVVSGISVFPGVDDDGTGTNSPQYGLSQATSSYLSADLGYLQGNSGAVNMDFSGVTWMGGGIIKASGTTASPGSVQGQQLLSGIESDLSTFGGNLDLHNAGTGLKVAEGSNAKQGTAVLNGTTAVVVSNTSVTASSRIFLTINTPGGTPASPYVFARTPGTSFSIKSTGASDSSTVAYQIFEPG